jgi:undecaprenyl-diphosphatase
MPIWQAVVLGVVQGLTEFLPISSTAHLLLVQQLFGRSQEELETDPFTIVIQLGTVFAVFAYFRADVAALVRGWLLDARHLRIFSSLSPEGRMVKLVIIGTIPVVLVGLFLKDWLKATFYNAPSIGVVAIVFAVLMWLAEVCAVRRWRQAPARGPEQLGWADAVWVGLWQALALMPGASRSGTTITAGLFAGMSRPTAARFSFVLSLPSVFAAGVKELYDWLKDVRASPTIQDTVYDQLTALALGTAVSFVVGYWSIAFLMRFLQRHSTLVFVLYRLGLGTLILTLVMAGMMTR